MLYHIIENFTQQSRDLADEEDLFDVDNMTKQEKDYYLKMILNTKLNGISMSKGGHKYAEFEDMQKRSIIYLN